MDGEIFRDRTVSVLESEWTVSTTGFLSDTELPESERSSVWSL